MSSRPSGESSGRGSSSARVEVVGCGGRLGERLEGRAARSGSGVGVMKKNDMMAGGGVSEMRWSKMEQDGDGGDGVKS